MGNKLFEGLIIEVKPAHSVQNRGGDPVKVQEITMRGEKGRTGSFSLCDRKEIPADMKGRRVRIGGYRVSKGKVYLGPKGSFVVLKQAESGTPNRKDSAAAAGTGTARDRVKELCTSLSRAIEDIQKLTAEMDVSAGDMLSLAKTLFIHRQTRKMNGDSGLDLVKRFMEHARELAKKEKLADGDVISLVNTLVIQTRYTRIG